MELSAKLINFVKLIVWTQYKGKEGMRKRENSNSLHAPVWASLSMPVTVNALVVTSRQKTHRLACQGAFKLFEFSRSCIKRKTNYAAARNKRSGETTS